MLEQLLSLQLPSELDLGLWPWYMGYLTWDNLGWGVALVALLALSYWLGITYQLQDRKRALYREGFAAGWGARNPGGRGTIYEGGMADGRACYKDRLAHGVPQMPTRDLWNDAWVDSRIRYYEHSVP